MAVAISRLTSPVVNIQKDVISLKETQAGKRAEHHTKLFKQGLLPSLTLFRALSLSGESDCALDPGAAATTELQQLRTKISGI